MIKLYNEDCHTGCSKIEANSVNLVLVDPPYGTTPLEWDSILDFTIMWDHYKRILVDNGCVLIFGQEPFSSFVRLSNLKWYKYDWYWQKERLTNIFQVKRRPGKVIETISVFYNNQCQYYPQKTKHSGKRVSNKVKGTFSITTAGNETTTPVDYEDDGTRHPLQLIQFNRDNIHSTIHETQKPLELIKYFIHTYTAEGDMVVDHCMGSGTTAIACGELERNFIGFEKDADKFQSAQNRIENHIVKKSLF